MNHRESAITWRAHRKYTPHTPPTMMNGSCNELFLEKISIIVPCFTKNSSVGMREQRRALYVFTAGERFDLLQDAMSVFCGPKMCVFRKVHIVYSGECASVC